MALTEFDSVKLSQFMHTLVVGEPFVPYFALIKRWIWEAVRIPKQWLNRHGWFRDKKQPWSPSDDTGAKGEDLAADFLTTQGYQILRRNFKRTWGEIDIIAVDKETIVYVEVKSRNSRKSRPELAVNAAKRQQMIRVAKSFAAENNLLHQSSRFDIIAVLAPCSTNPELHHFKHAFRNDSAETAFTRFH